MQHAKAHPKMWFFYVTFAASMLLLSACISPLQAITGDVVTQEMEFEDFNEVEVSDAFTVQIHQGDEYRVTLELDQASLPYLDVNTSGDKLEIKLRPRASFFLWNYNSTLRAEITMPTLVGITAHDATHIDVNGFSTDEEARLEATDASSIKGEIDTGDTHLIASDASNVELEGDRGDIEIEANDASKVKLNGEGGNAIIRAADASNVDLSDFPIQDAKIEARDASSVTVDASGTLDANARDGSHIVYYGDPTMGDVDSSAGSSVEARDR